MTEDNREPGVPWSRFLAEFIGTFFVVFAAAASLVMAVYLGNDSGPLFPAFIQGAVVAAAMGATIQLSGGHLNPAVTVGVWTAGAIEGRDALGYLLAQFGAAIIAALFAGALFPTEAVEASKLGQPLLAAGVDGETAFGLLAVLSTLVVFTWFGTVADRGQGAIRAGANGLAVGLATFGALALLLPFTRGGVNPARAMGPALVGGTMDNALIFLLAPVIGGILAGTSFRLIWARQQT